MATINTKTRRNTKDLSKVGHNPTQAIEECYQVLMSYTDPAELHREAIELVRKHGGVSERNRKRFEATCDGLKDSLAKLQAYVTNFMLAGCGMSVIGGGRRYS